MPQAPESVQRFHKWFRLVFIDDLAEIIEQKRTIAGLILAYTGIEALAGRRFPDDGNGLRFRKFVRRYFARPYREHATDLWQQRNRTIHDFTGMVSHGHPRNHLTRRDGWLVLNLEDFHRDLLAAAKTYFAELQSPSEAQDVFLKYEDRRAGLEPPRSGPSRP